MLAIGLCDAYLSSTCFRNYDLLKMRIRGRVSGQYYIAARHVKRGSIRKTIEPAACFPDVSNYCNGLQFSSTIAHGENCPGRNIYI